MVLIGKGRGGFGGVRVQAAEEVGKFRRGGIGEGIGSRTEVSNGRAPGGQWMLGT